MSTINSNISAQTAKENFRIANASLQSSISKISSGNRISRSSDDVAGLTIGTILATNVSTLRTALTNTAQADSLLKIADGGLASIGKALERQKALAVQANSGTLSSTQRGFLNQEFQNLTKEIDRLAGGTNFNGVNLLNGNLFSASAVKSDVTTGTRGSLTMQLTADFTDSGQSIIIAGTTFTMTTATQAGDPLEIAIGADATATMANIAEKVNSYFAGAAVNAGASQLTAKVSGNTITFYSKIEGTDGNNITVSKGGAGPASISFNGATTTTADTVNAATAGGINGGLIKGRVDVGGTVGDALIGAVADANFDNITSNKDFIGKISGFKASYQTNDRISLEVKIGDVTYSTQISDTTPAVATTYRLSGNKEGSGFFDIQLAANGLAVTNQTDADTFARRLDGAFSTLKFSQTRTLDSYKPGGSIFDQDGTTVIGNLTGSKTTLKGVTFDNVNIESVKVKAETASADNNASIEVVINGEVYKTNDLDGGTAQTTLTLTNVNDGSKVLTIGITGNALATGVSLDTAFKAGAVQKALEQALGVGQGTSGAKFQVGVTGADTIDVAIKSADSKTLFKDQALDISTTTGAATASAALDSAIASLSSIRADIGSLQSRFNFASSGLANSIQNLDAARSGFLDTDITEESTNFATAQVKTQASISILAQANQLSQNLLKLIG